MKTSFTARPIEAHTKGELHRLRREGQIPISIQHRGDETLHLQEEAKPLEEYIRHHGTSSMMEIDIEPEHSRQTVMVHDIQRDPLTHRLLHVTFQRVVGDEPIKTHVSLNFTGEPEEVRHRTAVVTHLLETIEIRCLPRDIPTNIPVDISELTHATPLRVSDLPKTDKYEILTPSDAVLVTLTSVNANVDMEEEAASTEATPAV